MTQTEPDLSDLDLPFPVADLIRRGNQEREAREADARRAIEAAEAIEAGLMAVFTAEVRAAVTDLPAGLKECLTLPHSNAAGIRANGWVTAVIRLAGCCEIGVNVERETLGWRVGRTGESDPFRVGGSTRHATLAEAAATARTCWLRNQPVPAGLS